jgi:hypothetical protein
MPRIGIIAEGRPDQAVLENIIESFGDDYEVILIRPELLKDETDIKLQNDAAAGGLARVKKDCEEQTLFDSFFAFDFMGEDLLVIQIDTAEIEDYGVVRPAKKGNENYVVELRENTIEKLREWLGDCVYLDKMVYAISIEELEAWMLTLYEKKDSVPPINPKAKLQRLLSKKNLSAKEDYTNYKTLTKDFRKRKKLKKILQYNQSLALFYEEFQAMIQEEE